MRKAPGQFLSGGLPLSDWYGLWSAIDFKGPVEVGNRIFFLSSALFLMSWLFVLVLLCGASRTSIAVALSLFFPIYLLFLSGILATDLLGGAVLLSLAAGAVLYSRS
jgi:hypothetical protein